MKRSSVLMILSAVLVVVGIAVSVAGALSVAADITASTDGGLRFTNEAVQEEFEAFMGSSGISLGGTAGFISSTQSYGRSFESIEVYAVDTTVLVQVSEDEAYHVDYAYHTSCPITIREEGGTLTIRQEYKGFFSWFGITGSGSPYITISIPKGQLLRHISCNTVSGELRVAGMGGVLIDAFYLNSTSGGIYTERLEADQIVLGTVSGTIKTDAVAESITLSTTSGEIISGCTGDELQISTVSGEVDMHKLSFQNATFSSVSGDLTLTVTEAPESVRLQFSTVSGEIDVAADQSLMNGDRLIDVDTVSGRLDLMFE